jgi:hypothetical protein
VHSSALDNHFRADRFVVRSNTKPSPRHGPCVQQPGVDTHWRKILVVASSAFLKVPAARPFAQNERSGNCSLDTLQFATVPLSGDSRTADDIERSPASALLVDVHPLKAGLRTTARFGVVENLTHPVFGLAKMQLRLGHGLKSPSRAQ